MSYSCGIDSIVISFKDSLNGFEAFLESLDGRLQRIPKDNYNLVIKLNVDGVGYVGSYNLRHHQVKLPFAALKNYSSTKAYKRWILLSKVYQHYHELNFKIRELHFAMDLPYWYSDVTIHPNHYTFDSHYPSSTYFDTRNRKLKRYKTSKHQFVIYDKSLKCGLATPLTRVELRLMGKELENILQKDDVTSHEEAQIRLFEAIKEKFDDIELKKGRSNLPMDCDILKAITIAMLYISGDDSLIEAILSHRTKEISDSHKLFKEFLKACKEYKITKVGARLPSSLKPFVETLTKEEKNSPEVALANYLNYSKWYKNKGLFGKIEQFSKRSYIKLSEKQWSESKRLFHRGVPKRNIARYFGVSYPTVIRYYKKRQIKIADLEDAIFAL